MTGVLSRRTFVATATAALTLPPRPAGAAPPKGLTLDLVPQDMVPQTGEPPVPAWRFAPDAAPRFVQGDAVIATVNNRLPVAALIHWRGLDGAAELEPILAHGPVPPGASASYALNFANAGTLICDARLGGGERPLPVLPVVVTEAVAPADIDRDEVLLIEDWRASADGDPIYTVNGRPTLKLDAAAHQRLRLRFINGAQRAVLAVELVGATVVVMAIDGQPAEPFPARDGRLVMASGTRIDTVVDVGGPFHIMLNDGVRAVRIAECAVKADPTRSATASPPRPLPSNGLPERLDLKSALRIDLPLDGKAANAALFRVARGRTVVMALINPLETAVNFQLHGHHMRLLDRLDDGWKPFWLDTVTVPDQTTLRVAFQATAAGAYLIETAGTRWGDPKVLRHYRVEP